MSERIPVIEKITKANDEIAALNLSRLDNKAILLAHLTRRTSLRRAKQLLGKILPDDTMGKIGFLMDRQRKVGSAPNAPQRQSSTSTPSREPNEK